MFGYYCLTITIFFKISIKIRVGCTMNDYWYMISSGIPHKNALVSFKDRDETMEGDLREGMSLLQ